MSPLVDEQITVDLDDAFRLAYIICSQTLAHTPPARDSMPLLDDAGYEAVLRRIKAVADDLRDSADTHGIDLYRSVL